MASRKGDEIAKLRTAFEREAKKYVRYLRAQIKSGMFMSSNVDTPLFKAFDALVAAEFHKSRKGKGAL